MEIKTEKEFDEFINNNYVLIDFYADWCGPCKMLSPVLDELASSRSEVKIAKVNVDRLQGLAQKYGVMSIPTLLLFKGGNLIDKKIGFNAMPVLSDWINENI